MPRLIKWRCTLIILGIVPASEVPPTLEKVENGLVIRFFRHNPRLIRYVISRLKKKVEAGEDVDDVDFLMRVLKKTVVIDLKVHVSGHAQIRLNKEKFLALLDF